MTKVIIALTMSLDGFIAGPGDTVEQQVGKRGTSLFGWYFTGDTPIQAYQEAESRGVPVPPFKLSASSARVFDEIVTGGGAVVTGRRTYDISGGWGGNGPLPGLPVWVLTSRDPGEVPKGESEYTFTDDLPTAIEEAKAAAGDRYVSLMGASVAQQGLKAGLVDEIQLHLVPILLTAGVRLFDHLGSEAVELDCVSVVDSPGVTHLRYRVVR